MNFLKTLLILLISEMGVAQACPFQSFLDLEKQGPIRTNPSTLISDRVKWEDALKFEFSKDTEMFFQLYTTLPFDPASIRCDAVSDRLQDKLDNNFASLFLKFAALRLTHSQNLTVRDYATRIVTTLDSGFIMPTKLFLHLGDHHPSEKPAGYDRSNKGIFFDLLEIDPAAFNIYLIHEFAHAFDPKLAQAINTFNDSQLTADIAAMVRSKKQLAELSADDRSKLDQYILAGLNRGILAELRAWITTSTLYLDLVNLGEQSPVGFMDQILGSNRSLTTQQLAQIWQEYLFKNFEKPNTNLFASPLLQEDLNVILNSLRAKSKTHILILSN